MVSDKCKERKDFMRVSIALSALILLTSNAFALLFIIDAGGFTGYIGENPQDQFDVNYMPTYIAGGAGELLLEISHATTKAQNVNIDRASNRWPVGLHIEVGRWDTVTQTCQIDSILREQLNLHIWRASGWSANDSGNPMLHFLFSLPESLAGQVLCFHATWVDSPWGSIEARPVALGYNNRFAANRITRDSVLPAVLTVAVTAPRTEADRQQARESHVYEAWIAGESRQTLKLADSLLAQGWGSFDILRYAEGAAQELKQFDRALGYLDSCYQQYGRVGAASDPTTQAREYERMRSKILSDKNQQQQH
jgi:hypothetical protein